jgi:hypothetical protein
MSNFLLMQQTTNTILMVRPINFRMNEQTAVNNYYQKVLDNILPETINRRSQQEFDAYVEKLRGIGVHVIVVSDNTEHDIHQTPSFLIIGCRFTKMVL